MTRLSSTIRGSKRKCSKRRQVIVACFVLVMGGGTWSSFKTMLKAQGLFSFIEDDEERSLSSTSSAAATAKDTEEWEQAVVYPRTRAKTTDRNKRNHTTTTTINSAAAAAAAKLNHSHKEQSLWRFQKNNNTTSPDEELLPTVTDEIVMRQSNNSGSSIDKLVHVQAKKNRTIDDDEKQLHRQTNNNTTINNNVRQVDLDPTPSIFGGEIANIPYSSLPSNITNRSQVNDNFDNPIHSALVVEEEQATNLSQYYYNYYHNSLESSSSSSLLKNQLWNTSSTLLPTWLTDYFSWHQHQRTQLNESTWQQDQFRFLIPTAFRGRKSGGMTDRIRPIPAFLRLAAQTKRLLLIYWERPFPLEEFLLPPVGGMDWRVPDYMISTVSGIRAIGTNLEPIAKAAERDTSNRIVTAQYQSWNYGELWYKEQMQEGEPPLYNIFRDIWRVVFTPAPPVARRIHANFQRMGLIPGEFATSHMRMLYAVEDRPQQEIEKIARNAMNCVSNLRPTGPFFVASDSFHAIETAISYGKEKNVTVVAPQHPRQPLHVDFSNESDTSLTPADFYDGFVDLYLMAGTRCAAVGPGGFARWGHLLGYNETCVIHHFGRKSQKCEWNDGTVEAPMPGYPSEKERKVLQAEAKSDIPRFPLPMLL